jgi:eukaryotic-like serine/threonine-protein kinase
MAMPITAGAHVGPYEVLGLLDDGGMGEVYRARDTRLDRLVAIKTIKAFPHAGPAQLERFKREARAISRVSHPHICALYDIGEQDGVAFLVMELLDGETLARQLADGPLPLDRACAVAADVADALDAAHRHGVIHRDLKPSNVMLTKRGVKLLDFGLAKFRTGELDQDVQEPTRSIPLTQPSAVVGTLPYMAPEQVEGHETDARTDIFALGVVCYEMATGRRPFQASSHASLAAAILIHEPPPVSSLTPLAPATLDRIVRKCLAKNPDERWQSAHDLAAELRWIAEGDTSGKAAPGLAPRPSRTRRTAIVAAGLGAAVTAATLWGLSARGLIGSASAPVPRWTPVTFRAGTISGARFASDGNTVVYSAAWGGQPYALFMTRPGSAESRALGVSNARLLGISSSGDLAFLTGAHEAVKAFYATPGTLARVPLGGGGSREILEDVTTADWLPRGTELAVVRHRSVEWPIGKKIYSSQRHALTYLRLAPSGDRLALFEGGSIIVLDRSGRKQTLASGLVEAGSLVWSAAGDEIWFSGVRSYGEPALRAVSMSGAERVLLHAPPMQPLIILDLLGDGRALIVRHHRQKGFSCLAPGETQPRELGWLDFSAPEALSADGRTVVFGEVLTASGSTQVAYLRKTDGSDAVRLGDGYPEDLSPDGRSVLVGIRSSQPPRWVILPTGPGEAQPLPAGAFDALLEANFLPDGKRIVFGGVAPGQTRRIYVQDLSDGVPRPISPEGVDTVGLATPDGRFVLGWSQGRHTLYPVDEGAPRPLASLAADDRPVQWSPDGRLLFVRRRSSWPPVIDRVDMVTGQRQLWRVVSPADPVGVDEVSRILITPDAKSYCHDYLRWVSQLFIVDGLR